LVSSHFNLFFLQVMQPFRLLLCFGFEITPPCMVWTVAAVFFVAAADRLFVLFGASAGIGAGLIGGDRLRNGVGDGN
jgi:hypothetical protein